MQALATRTNIRYNRGMSGAEIRRLRKARGLTQKELADLVGCSQPFVSSIERGDTRAPSWLARLERALTTITPPAPRGAQEAESVFSASSRRIVEGADRASAATNAGVRWTTWARPRVSGDLGFVLPLPRDQLLVVALDVVGHGPSAVPGAMYLRGWIRGWVRNLSAPPQLTSFVADLNDELRVVGIEAALFAALLGRSGGSRHSITYEGLSCGHPGPVLSLGPPMKTLASCELSSLLPADDHGAATVRHEISAPWRLTIASDGLLSRLGRGLEQQGLSEVMKWQMGYQRDRLHPLVAAPALPPADDELMLIVEGTGWDQVATASADESGRARLIEATCQRALPSVGPARVADLRQAIWEAVDNVQQHAGSSVFALRHREEPTGFRVEVIDEGCGMVPEDADREESGFAVMRRLADLVEARANDPAGTIVTLIFNKQRASKGGLE